MENQKVNEVDENLLRMTNAAMQVSEGMKTMVDCIRTQYTLIAQLTAGNVVVGDTPVVAATPPVMTPPVAAATPPVMTPPVVSEPVDEYAEIRFEAITTIKALIDVYGLDWSDCKEIVTAVTGAAQNDEEVTFGALTYDQYPLIRDKFDAIIADYERLKGIADQVYIDATPAHKDMVDGQVKVLLAPFNTESFDGIYYADLDAVKVAVAPWAKQWSDWAIQVANAAQAGQ